MKTLATIVAAGILFFSLTDSSMAQVPRIISYQGVLTDSTGIPKMDDDYNFVFRFYKAASGGTAIWEESKTLPVSRGLFSTMLGDQSVFPDSVSFTQAYWLSVEVEGTELSPRIRLGAVGYALHAINADTATFVLNAASVQRPLSPGISEEEIQNNAVTSQKIADGSIATSDVAPDFKAPRADTADFALSAVVADNSVGTPSLQDSAVTGAKIAAGSITSDQIQDGSISTADVSENFKAPKSDTADVALAALSSAPTGLAGGDLAGEYPNPTIADGVVNSLKIGDGTIQRTDVAADFKAPRADTADFAFLADTANVALSSVVGESSVGTSELQDGAVTNSKLAADAVTTDKIADGTVTGDDILDGSISQADLVSGFTVSRSDTATVAESILTTADVTVSSISGDGGGLENLDASNLAQGTVPSGRILGEYSGAVQFTNGLNQFSGIFSGDGSALTDIVVTGAAGGDLSGTFPNPAIADSAITTSKIPFNAVTDPKIAGLNASKLFGALPALDGSALTGVVASVIADSAVSTGKILFGAVTDAKITSLSASKLFGTLPALDGSALTGVAASVIADSAVSTSKILFNAVTDPKIAGLNASKLFGALPALDGSALTGVAASTIADSAVSTGKILFGAVTDAKITSLSASKLFGTLPAIDGSALTGVAASVIADSAVSTSKILDNAVTNSKVASLDAAKLFGTLASDRLSGAYSNALTFSNISNSFTGDGSGLTNLTASALTGTVPEGSLSGTYSNALSLSNTGNNFTGRSLTIDDSTLYVDDANNRIGIGTANPTSSFDVQGSFGLKIRKLTSNDGSYDAGEETVFLVDLSGGDLMINLPSAANVPGRLYSFKIIGEVLTGTLTIDPFGGELIDDLLTRTLNILFKSVTIISDGTKWFELALIN